MVTSFPRTPPEAHGGVEIACLRLAEGLAAYDDIDLHVIALGPLPPTTERWTAPQCTVHRVRRRWPGYLTYWNLTRRDLARLLLEIKPDVVNILGAAAWLPAGLPMPSVLTVHGIAEKNLSHSDRLHRRLLAPLVGLVERRARRRFGHVIAISPYVMEALAGQVRGQVHFIENAVDDAYFNLPRSEVPNRVLFVGVHSPEKNVHGLVDVARRLAASGTDFQMHLVGEPSSAGYLARVKAEAEAAGLGGRVCFLGWRDREGIGRELAEAACLVLASFQETAPVVIEEAMAAGIPVVATKVGGVPYMVADGQTGFLVESGDMAGFADRVRQLLGSKPLREEMGHRAAEEARRRFAPDAIAEKTRKVYYEVAGRDVRIACREPASQEGRGSSGGSGRCLRGDGRPA